MSGRAQGRGFCARRPRIGWHASFPTLKGSGVSNSAVSPENCTPASGQGTQHHRVSEGRSSVPPAMIGTHGGRDPRQAGEAPVPRTWMESGRPPLPSAGVRPASTKGDHILRSECEEISVDKRMKSYMIYGSSRRAILASGKSCSRTEARGDQC
jgi:hypothetical protein